MLIGGILEASWVLPRLAVASRAEVLGAVAAHLGEHCQAVAGRSDEVHAALAARERLASTGVGDGVAIPHAKMDGLERLVGAFACLERGVDFAANDGQPVRLIFALLIPRLASGAHLKALARISRLLKDGDTRRQLLAERDAAGLWRALVAADGQG